MRRRRLELRPLAPLGMQVAAVGPLDPQLLLLPVAPRGQQLVDFVAEAVAAHAGGAGPAAAHPLLLLFGGQAGWVVHVGA